MPTIGEIREQAGGAYAELSDQKLAEAIHKKFYPQVDFEVFAERVGLPKAPGEDVAAGMALSGVPVLGAYVPQAEAAIRAAAQPLTGVGEPGATFSERYARNLPLREADYSRAEREQPIASTALKIGGGTAALAPLGATALGARALGATGPMAARIPLGAASGAGISAADAWARNEPVLPAAMLGGGLGAAAAPVGQAAGAAVQGVRNLLPGAPTAAERLAGQMGRAALTADDLTQPVAIAARRAELGPQGTAAEYGENLRGLAQGIATQPGPGRQHIFQAMEQRAAGARARIDDNITAALGPRQDLALVTRGEQHMQATAADPLYDAFRSTVVHPTAQIRALVPVLERDGLLAEAQRLMALEGRPAQVNFFVTGNRKTWPTTEAFDYVKQAIDGRIGEALRSGNRNLARIYTGVKRRLDNAIANSNPDAARVWREARDAWGNPAGIMNAREAGQDAFMKGTRRDEMRLTLQDMTPPEFVAYREGARDALSEMMDASVRGDTNVRNLLLAPAAREKLMIIGRNQAAARLPRNMERELGFTDTLQRLIGNSQTASRIAMGEVTKPPAGGGAVSQYFRQLDLGRPITWPPWRAGFDSAQTMQAGRQAANYERARDILARDLMNQGAAGEQSLLRLMNMRPPGAVDPLVSRATTIGLQGAIPNRPFDLPRRQAGGPVEEGEPYLVGEREPELFVPDRSGTIVPLSGLQYTREGLPFYGPDAKPGVRPGARGVEIPRVVPPEARAVGQAIAPELTSYLTEPEPSYESRLRERGASLERPGKVPSTDDPRIGPATQNLVDLAGMAAPAGAIGGAAKYGAMAAAGIGAGRLAKAAPAAGRAAARAGEAPMLLGNPELRGSMSTTANIPFTYRGKGPAEWTPQEFEAAGKHFNVPRLGPESPAQAFRYSDEGVFNIPGGLEGKFTYYDLLRMKAEGIDPSRIPRELHTQLHQKLMRSMDVEQPVSPERTWSGLMFGMTSPNNPLFPNQLTQSILRMREPGLRQQLADQIPWKVGDKVSKEERLAASDRIADMFGLSAASKGGLGSRGSTDYSRIGELAQMWEKNPQWFTKTAEESWPNYVERLTSQVTGTSMKTGSFGGVWQDPTRAGISAIDRHMVNEFERTGTLFPNKAEQAAFEKRAVERWNNANEGDKVTSYDDLKEKGEGFLTKMKLEYVGNEQHAKLRTPTGGINPRIPPHLARTDWPAEPSHVKLMGDAYRRALDWNQQLATQHGLNLFPSQWLEWDRIRRRFEPHENMFPGLERMPAMSRDQLRQVSAEHTASGHKTYNKIEGDEGMMSLPPTKPRPDPARFAYFTLPPAGLLGLLGRERE